MDGCVARVDRIGYGVGSGMLVAAICAIPDVIVATLWGYRVPASLPGIVFAAYLVCGGLMGAVFGVASGWFQGRRSRWADADGAQAGIRAACCAACLAGLAAVFVERLRLGYEGYLDRETGLFPAVAAVLVGLLCASRPPRLLYGRSWSVLGWPAFCAAAFCAFWQPYVSQYQAATFSKTSLLANAGYCVGWVALYLLLRRPAQWVLPRLVADGTRGSLVGSGITVGVGLVCAAGVLWCRSVAPIDKAYNPTFAGGLATAGPTPSVVLIVIDTARADHMSMYGYPVDTTPRLAAFAKESVRYDRAIASSSWTLPSHASLFTGLLPTEHGAHNIPHGDGWTIRPLAESHVTMAEILSAAGYRTGAVLANTACLSREFGVEQGFLYFDDRAKPTLEAAKIRSISPALWLCRGYQRSLEGWRTDWSRNASEVNADALDWVDRDTDSPFFLFVNYLDPHAPYHAHGAFASRLARVADHGRPAQMADEIARYDQEIAFTDAQIGTLFDELRSRGVYDDTMIIVTSDHGEAFGEHGSKGHGHTLYDEEIRVPLLVKYPGASVRGVRSEAFALTEVAGLVYEELDISFAAGIDTGADRIFAELREVDTSFAATESVPVMRALYDASGGKAIVSSRGATEYYDLLADPFERCDLSDQRFDRLERAIARVDCWTAGVAARRRAESDSVAISDALRERLMSLGYLR